jgi:ubiquitin carboxyl-terminal hydrolase 8
MNNFDKEINVKGLSGLYNIGNTCYMNSALQCLSASLIFTSYILKKKFVSDIKENIVNQLYKKEYNKLKDSNDEVDSNTSITVYLDDIKKEYYNSLTYNIYKLFKNMWKINSVIVPKTLKEKIELISDKFVGFQQHDAEEFINYILNQIHEELKIDVELQYKNISNNILEYIKSRNNLYKDLSEEYNELKLNTRIQEFKKFIKTNEEYELNYKFIKFWKKYLKNNYSPIIEIFTGQYIGEIICSNCNNKSTNFEPFTILQLPIPNNTDTLQNCLKNFSMTDYLNDDNKYKCDNCKTETSANKTIYIWDLPELLIIQLKRFSYSKNRLNKNNNIITFPLENLEFNDNYHKYRIKNYKYDLYGVISHYGNLSGGHYIAYTKNELNNKWYKYNDSSVYYIDDINNELNNNAYILFYKKKYVNNENLDINESENDSSDNEK